MAPEPKLLNDLIRAHPGDFTSIELWVSDELAKFLATKRDLSADTVAIVVDLDDLDPVNGVADGSILLRYNGRFFPPSKDFAGKPLKTTPEEWREMVNEWFSSQSIEVAIDEDSTDVLKFTAMIPSIVLPDEVTEDADAGGDEESTEETDEPADEGGDDQGGDDEESTLDELEDALN